MHEVLVRGLPIYVVADKKPDLENNVVLKAVRRRSAHRAGGAATGWVRGNPAKAPIQKPADTE
ncbi:hypothetical protein [Mesorhizobium sp. WSM2239]|uniref:Uncharacterized protein n=2 Tax=unclassified Mesorhizobium TaxID=325217 RepID=A0AAU8DHT7_9HYPH